MTTMITPKMPNVYWGMLKLVPATLLKLLPSASRPW